MEKKVHAFLETGLLDKYLIGATTAMEDNKVDAYIAQYPEVKEEFDILQVQLELAARSNAINPPAHTLDGILKAIDSPDVVQLHTRSKIPYWFSVAASVATLIFAGSSYIFYNQNKSLLLTVNPDYPIQDKEIQTKIILCPQRHPRLPIKKRKLVFL